jgi:hypothetical protein
MNSVQTGFKIKSCYVKTGKKQNHMPTRNFEPSLYTSAQPNVPFPPLDLNIDIDEQYHLLDDFEFVNPLTNSHVNTMQDSLAMFHKKEFAKPSDQKIKYEIPTETVKKEQPFVSFKYNVEKLKILKENGIKKSSKLIREPIKQTTQTIIKRVESIRARYSEEAKQILENWYKAHERDPYPESSEKQLLAEKTKLSITQVSSWLSRRRGKDNKWVSRRVLM